MTPPTPVTASWPRAERSQHVLQRSSLAGRILTVAEWMLLLAAVAVWIVGGARQPQMNVGAVMLGSSIGARVLRTGRVLRRTPVDLPLLVFMGSVVIAYAVAADQVAALYRLLLLLCAVGIFYAVVESHERTREIVADAFVVLVAGGGLYLVSQHDWAGAPARFELVGRLGVYLSQIVPRLGDGGLHWNVVRNGSAAVIGLAVPIGAIRLVGLMRARSMAFRGSPGSGRRVLRAAAVGAATFVMLFSLLLTESRMPWLAYLAITGLALLWWLSGKLFPGRRRRAFAIGVAVLTAAGFTVFAMFPAIGNAVPGPDNLGSRAEINTQAWKLAQDTALTGGGLGQFSALYSSYIQGIPHALFLAEDTGSSAYLNVLVEQGWFGMIGFGALLAIAALTAIARLDAGEHGLVAAGAVGVAFLILYGISHSMLVATRVIPFGLVPVALVSAGGPKISPSKRLHLRALVVLALGVTVALMGLRRQLIAGWFANLGAVEMAKAELVGWPTGKWDDGGRVGELAPAEDLFLQALDLDPANRAANHRLGLIRMLERDYQGALAYLEVAHAQDQEHRGIRKALGQAYVWTGDYERAYLLLEALPESASELRVYEWWWGTQGREDLASNASAMVDLLDPGPQKGE